MSVLPVKPEFAAGFLFRIIVSEQTITRDKLLQAFSGVFLASFRGNMVKLDDAFSHALAFLFQSGLANHDDANPPTIFVNKNFKQ